MIQQSYNGRQSFPYEKRSATTLQKSELSKHYRCLHPLKSWKAIKKKKNPYPPTLIWKTMQSETHIFFSLAYQFVLTLVENYRNMVSLTTSPPRNHKYGISYYFSPKESQIWYLLLLLPQGITNMVSLTTSPPRNHKYGISYYFSSKESQIWYLLLLLPQGITNMVSLTTSPPRNHIYSETYTNTLNEVPCRKYMLI